jgi:hypothetical protein
MDRIDGYRVIERWSVELYTTNASDEAAADARRKGMEGARPILLVRALDSDGETLFETTASPSAFRAIAAVVEHQLDWMTEVENDGPPDEPKPKERPRIRLVK